MYIYIHAYTHSHMCIYIHTYVHTHTDTHTYVQVHYVNVGAMPCSRTEVDKAQSLPSRSLQSSVTVPLFTVLLAYLLCELHPSNPSLKVKLLSSNAECWRDYGINLENSWRQGSSQVQPCLFAETLHST